MREETDEIERIANSEKVQHLLEEAEKAFRLRGAVDGDALEAVDRALDTLFKDIGRTVYNAYWEEELAPGEVGAQLAEITSEVPTEQVKIIARPVETPPVGSGIGFDPVGPGPLGESDDHTDLPDDPTGIEGDDPRSGWYTDEVEVPDKPMFSEADGLEEDIPESDPIPGT